MDEGIGYTRFLARGYFTAGLFLSVFSVPPW